MSFFLPTSMMGGNAHARAHKRVYRFQEGSIDEKALLGNKGANLSEMTRIGLPVPPGMIITTECCLAYYENNNELPDGLADEYLACMEALEQQTGRKFGNADTDLPLLVSVRSGAAVSMPGMMDTILNLGLNDANVEKVAERTGNARWAYDCYRRLLMMWGTVVDGQSNEEYENALQEYKESKGYSGDVEMDGDDWKNMVTTYKTLVDLPQDPWEQLEGAIKAVFSSWFTPRAVRYRAINSLPDNMGTAVNIQAMVYGNVNDNSGTGVAFTRNPATGERVFYGEYLRNAEGEDVVAGVRTPLSLEDLKEIHPQIYEELDGIQQLLERHYRDMQDIEFTIEDGRLYILQTRTGKRTAIAAVRMATEMVSEGLINEREAIMRVDAEKMDFFLHPMIDPNADTTVLAKGLPASPGAATGRVVFNSHDAEAMAEAGEIVILVRHETSPEDIHGMKAAVGILTAQGGMTSHAAVVARGMGKCCVVGCGALQVDYGAKQFTVTSKGENATTTTVKEGDTITIDGSHGDVILGDVPTVSAGSDECFQTVLAWADKFRRMRVMTNADTPQDARRARELGAEGIGLCRTEHMFFDENRIDVMRSMILESNEEARQPILGQLFEFQKEDMVGLFRAMDGFPVTVRTLDPPLHEFLPQEDAEMTALAERLGRDPRDVNARIRALYEHNPMLGFRGCRVSIVYPDITRMQVRAIITAALECKKDGVVVHPEIMIPLVSTDRELDHILPDLQATIQKVFEDAGDSVNYQFGAMVETPRACMRADAIARDVSFLSFGTNDLTQMTFGFSRDDLGKFVPRYVRNKILEHDPFQRIDERGVGSLMRLAIQKGKYANPRIKIGICGEVGGEPHSIGFFHRIGLHYVSCSPFRVPIARIAAAQARIEELTSAAGTLDADSGNGPFGSLWGAMQALAFDL